MQWRLTVLFVPVSQYDAKRFIEKVLVFVVCPCANDVSGKEGSAVKGTEYQLTICIRCVCVSV
jgi:hypothetical protein